jgi:hypothetical protein
MILSIMCWYPWLFFIVFPLMRLLQVGIQFMVPMIKGTEEQLEKVYKFWNIVGIAIAAVLILIAHISVAIV